MIRSDQNRLKAIRLQNDRLSDAGTAIQYQKVHLVIL